VTVRGAETLEWLRDYIQLDVDLVKLYGGWAERDPVFAKLGATRVSRLTQMTGVVGSSVNTSKRRSSTLRMDGTVAVHVE
jgi:hypothetical protein